MCLKIVRCLALSDVHLLGDIDLDGGPRPEQLPHWRQRFDRPQEPSLCPLLPL
jgi:hypothetical protein